LCPCLAHYIDTYKKLQAVIKETQADGFMIGRVALGRPWIFAELLDKTVTINLPELITEHLQMLHEFYGEKIGVLHARKHFGWYLQHNQPTKTLCQKFNTLQTATQQLEFVARAASPLSIRIS
jgi:tRNA-dihydrouridine synthase B